MLIPAITPSTCFDSSAVIAALNPSVFNSYSKTSIYNGGKTDIPEDKSKFLSMLLANYKINYENYTKIFVSRGFTEDERLPILSNDIDTLKYIM